MPLAHCCATKLDVKLVRFAQRTLKFSDDNAARGRVAIVELRCHSCHRVAEDPALAEFPGALEGPLLHDLGKDSPEGMAWRLVSRTDLDPSAIYDTTMAEVSSSISDRQLVDLVAYLRNPRAARPRTLTSGT